MKLQPDEMHIKKVIAQTIHKMFLKIEHIICNFFCLAINIIDIFVIDLME